MKDSVFFVVIDSDGDDRALELGANQNAKSNFDTPEEAHAAIDRMQQRGETMHYLPWAVVERTQKVVGSYRRDVAIAFVEATPKFTPTES